MASMLGGVIADLGLGDMLADQVASETEEQRKKRMQQMQQSQMMGPEQSLAVQTLFGSRGVPGAGY
jgi:hypothetical protein